jgi:hypothetical protein
MSFNSPLDPWNTKKPSLLNSGFATVTGRTIYLIGPFDKLRMLGERQRIYYMESFPMKHYFYIIAMSISCSIFAASRVDDFAITLDPTWQILECDRDKCKEFGGKWVIIGSITFKKKAKEPVNLTRLYLHWNGAHLDMFVGSLYKKQEDKDFLAIQENLVCDGTWDTANQTILFNFDKKQTLGLTNIFYVVLTIPESTEPLIKQGSFELVTHYLPEQFQPATTQQLSLAYNARKTFFTK